MPNLPYITFSDADAEAAFTAMGLSKSVAASYVELMHGIAEGRFGSIRGNPNVRTAPTSFAHFVEEVFKPAYRAMSNHVMA